MEFNLRLEDGDSVVENETKSEGVRYESHINWDEYANIDADMSCHGQLTKEEIVRSLVQNSDENNKDEDIRNDDYNGDETNTHTLIEEDFAIKLLKSLSVHNMMNSYQIELKNQIN